MREPIAKSVLATMEMTHLITALTIRYAINAWNYIN